MPEVSLRYICKREGPARQEMVQSLFVSYCIESMHQDWEIDNTSAGLPFSLPRRSKHIYIYTPHPISISRLSRISASSWTTPHTSHLTPQTSDPQTCKCKQSMHACLLCSSTGPAIPLCPFNFPILYAFTTYWPHEMFYQLRLTYLLLAGKTSNTAQPRQTQSLFFSFDNRRCLLHYLLLCFTHLPAFSTSLDWFPILLEHISSAPPSIYLSIDLFTAPPSNLLSSDKESSCQAIKLHHTTRHTITKLMIAQFPICETDYTEFDSPSSLLRISSRISSWPSLWSPCTCFPLSNHFGARYISIYNLFLPSQLKPNIILYCNICLQSSASYAI